MMTTITTADEGAAATLPTAREKFASTEPRDPAPQTTHEWRELRSGKPMSKAVLVGGQQLPITGKTVQTVAWAVGFECSDQELSSLRALQAKMDGLHAELAKHGASNVVPERLRQQAIIHTAAQEGVSVSSMEVQSTESIRTSFRARANALRAALVNITHNEVAPLVMPIISRFAQSLETAMADAEIGDREWAAAYDVPYHPSIAWKTFAAVAQRSATRRMPHESSFATPRHLLGDLVEI